MTSQHSNLVFTKKQRKRQGWPCLHSLGAEESGRVSGWIRSRVNLSIGTAMPSVWRAWCRQSGRDLPASTLPGGLWLLLPPRHGDRSEPGRLPVTKTRGLVICVPSKEPPWEIHIGWCVQALGQSWAARQRALWLLSHRKEGAGAGDEGTRMSMGTRRMCQEAEQSLPAS